MPELPEVESVARLLRDELPVRLGGRINSVAVLDHKVFSGTPAEDVAERLTGAEFVSIGRHGKYLLCGMKSKGRDFSLVLHLRMTGRISVVSPGTAPGRHTRFTLGTEQGGVLMFDDPRRFGRAWMVDGTRQVVPGLGPDALAVTLEEFTGRIAGRGRHIKALLLDQSFVAGIGNIYADEILFRSGQHPCGDSSRLDGSQIARLHAATVSVLGLAVEVGGANIDGVFKAGRFKVEVYGRAGLPCYVCGEPIRKIRVCQRGTHFCPACQPTPAAGRQYAGCLTGLVGR